MKDDYNNINYWIIAPAKMKPCNPSPCGPNSICREINDQAVCTCAPEYLGTPPLCRPECLISSDCPQNQACLNQKCKDPCIGTCGIQAICLVVNHNPVCSCPEGYTGNPFIRCEISKKMNEILVNHHPAAHIPNVKWSTTLHPAAVCLNI